jgi:hypothetical protein
MSVVRLLKYNIFCVYAFNTLLVSNIISNSEFSSVPIVTGGDTIRQSSGVMLKTKRLFKGSVPIIS